ncbi:MAG: symmetrical bis(5'-nucleosyl)-tetraphosphatase [Dokdonella sp.]
MAVWAIGDLQGCHDELVELMARIDFDASRDVLWFCGDLVNRGGQSLAVLRTVKALGDRAVVVLGNHDLSLLAIAERRSEDQAKVNPELREVLFAPDRDDLLDWLRQCPLFQVDRTLGYGLLHAGLSPRWSIEDAESCAREIESRLRGSGYQSLLKQMFGNNPDTWSPRLRGVERLRAGINVFTRMRYCDVRGRIAFPEKGVPGTQRAGLYPWFEVPGMAKRDLRLVCGHWSALGRFHGLGVTTLDTGCVWGGYLTAMRIDVEEPQFVALKSNRVPPPGKQLD